MDARHRPGMTRVSWNWVPPHGTPIPDVNLLRRVCGLMPSTLPRARGITVARPNPHHHPDLVLCGRFSGRFGRLWLWAWVLPGMGPA